MTAPGLAPDFQVRLIELLHAASIEIPADSGRVEALRGGFDPGTEIFINQPPGGDYRRCVTTAAALKRAGFRPVPHVAARGLASLAELDDYLGRVVGEGLTDRVLLIAGDQHEPRGPFASVVDVLATGRIEAAGARTIGFAGHPEGHPLIESAELERALAAKCAYAAKVGLSCFIATQFCFSARPILDYLATLDRLGIGAPVRIGVAGPASLATLIKFAVRCGVGNSLKALRAQPKTIGRLIGEAGPEDLLHDLAVGLPAESAERIIGIHFYAFGGVARTSAWIETTLSRLYNAITTEASSS